MANNKARGNTVEREFARKISRWLTGSDEELVCWRVQDSGSVATNAIKRGQKYQESGDLRSINPGYDQFFKAFHVDTKAIKDVNLFLTYDNMKSNQVYQEWVKTVSDAKKNDKIPLMPVKWTGRRYQFIVYPSFLYTEGQVRMEYRDIGGSGNFTAFVIQEMNDFFKHNDWKILLEERIDR